jgi:outer membrane protein assembly factor BamB
MAALRYPKKGIFRLPCHISWCGFLCLALLPATFSFSAARFDAGQQPLGALAPLTLSNTNLSTGNVKAYRTWFENGSWQGDLIEYEVSTTGALSTGIDLTGLSPAESGDPPDTWSAHVQIEEAIANDAAYWSTGRKIITRSGGSQVAFRWPNLSAAQKLALDEASAVADASSSDILNYVRGDTSKEHPIGAFRIRTSILADMIHSNPVYVANPKAGFTVGGYAAFAQANQGREGRVYVGSNSGMLHAFDAETGNEKWAYIPSMLLPKLRTLAGRPHEHQYYVDGSLTVQDVNSGGWKTVLVGALGAGGKGWFGLDITSPDLSLESSASGDDAKVLWELSGANDNDLGDAFGQAVISQLNDGNWYAVFGNGYNSVNGIAKLYLVNVTSGAVTRIDTGSGNASSPNGLSSPTLVDRDSDGKADIVFAGDIDGNLWKFDLSSTTRGNWEVAYSGTPLHTGTAARPIIQPPDVTRHPLAGFLVFFGTGRLLTALDAVDTTVQALYGIWDNGETPPADQDLLAQTLSGDIEYTSGSITETVQTFNPDPDPINWSQHDGWVVELPAGYRPLQPPQLRAGRVKVIINNPAGRSNYLLEAYYVDGGSPGSAIFDLDQNGVLGVADNVDGNDNSDLTDSEDVAVMWRRPDGVMSQPTIARISDGVDTQLFNYIVPAEEVPCTGNCTGGFANGHIDVDTDYYNNQDGGTGDKTHKHTHQYDKEVDRTYVDYTDIVITDHVELNDASMIDPDREFIIVLANADLSPAGVITVGNVDYSAVYYQTMIHKKLRAWDGESALTDDDGNDLIFTANELASIGGTVRQTFTDNALELGGIHATDTSCVKNAYPLTNGRYRNGALTIQAIPRDLFSSSLTNQLDAVVVQDPTDMPAQVILGTGETIQMKEDFDTSGSFEAGNYEVMGGLRGNVSGAVGDDRALFESTLFWHAKNEDTSNISCYGSFIYVFQVAAAIDRLTFTRAEFDAQLAAQGITDLAAELQANLSCRDVDEADGGCAQYYQDLLALVELSESIWTDPRLPPTGLGGGGEIPVIVAGDAEGQGVTGGPNFRAGRRTWVDLIAD